MKARKYTISTSDLNDLEYSEINLTYTDSNGNTLYPTGIRYSNVSNATLGFLCLANDSEKLESATNPTYYDYLEIVAGDTAANLSATKYLRISKLSGTASGALTIYVYNYISVKSE